MEVDNPVFQHPINCIVFGSSQAGKSSWAKLLIEYAAELFDPVPQEFWWCYTQDQAGYKWLKENPAVRMIEGLPSADEIKATSDIPKLVIMDDLLQSLEGRSGDGGVSASAVVNLFINISHHHNASMVFLTQSLFFSGSLRVVRLNSHLLVLLKNPSDQSQISSLAKQIFPGNSKHLLDAYKDATRENYGYLVVDLFPKTDERLRLRTKIFPHQYPQIVYVPKDYK